MNKQVEIKDIAALADIHYEPIMLMDEDGKILFANAASSVLAPLVGDEGGYVVDSTVLDALSEASKTGEPSTVELSVDDAVFVCKLHLRPMGGNIGFFAHDMTNVLRSRRLSDDENGPLEDDLADREIDLLRQEATQNARLLSEALKALSEGIAIYDSHDRQVQCNAAYRDTYDYGDDFV